MGEYKLRRRMKIMRAQQYKLEEKKKKISEFSNLGGTYLCCFFLVLICNKVYYKV